MVIMRRLVGWGLMFFGLAISLFVPISTKNQTKEMSNAAVVIGIIVAGIGLLLIKL
jgi:hypothetical protein